jgi:hypothetical protein
MKAYATKKNTPSRMARKHARLETFMANKKATKIRRKADRLARRQYEQGEE